MRVTWPLLPRVIHALGEICLVAAFTVLVLPPVLAQPATVSPSVKPPEVRINVRRPDDLGNVIAFP